jgi:hypothetical protein
VGVVEVDVADGCVHSIDYIIITGLINITLCFAIFFQRFLESSPRARGFRTLARNSNKRLAS